MAAKKEIQIEYKAINSGFNSTVKDINSETRSLNNEFKLQEAQMKNTGSETEKLQARLEKLRKEHELAGQKTKAAAEALEKTKKLTGENSVETQKMSDKLIQAQTQEQRLKNAIDDTNSQLDAQGKEMQETGKQSTSLSEKLKTVGKVAAAGIAVASTAIVSGGAALFGMAKEAADTTDRIDKLSQKVGLSKQGFQEWEYVLSQNGMEIEGLQGGMKKLTTVADQAIQGTGRGAEIFDKLKISVRDVNGEVKDQETLFNESVAALQGMEDGTEKARLATELFGGAGAKLMPLLNGSAESVDELKAQAHELGIVLSDEAVASGAAFTDTLDNVQRSLGAVAAKVGAEVMPIVQTVLDWILKHMPTIQAVLSKVFDVIRQLVQGAINLMQNTLGPIFEGIIQSIQDNLPAIQATFQEVFGIIKTVVEIAFAGIKLAYDLVFKPIITVIIEIIKFLVDQVRQYIPQMRETFAHVFERIQETYNETLKPVIDVIREKLAELIEWVKEHWPQVKDIIGQVFQAIMTAYQTYLKVAFEAMLTVFKTVFNWFKDNWPLIQEIFKKVVDTVKNFWETILKPTFETIKDIAKSVVTWFIENWPAIQEKISQVFKGIMTVWNNVLWPVFKKVIEIALSVVNWFIDKWPMIQKVIKVAFDAIKLVWNTVLKPVFELLMKIVGKIKEVFEEKFVPIVKNVKKWFDDIKDNIKEKIEFAQEKVQGAIDKITGFFDGVKKVKDDVLGWFTDIKDGISDKIDGAREAVSGAIDKIKQAFDFKFSWPKLSMPKFSIKGSMNPLKWLQEGVPKLSVDWNAKGGIIPKTTVFAQGFGEAGPEAVVPLSGREMNPFADAVANRINQYKEALTNNNNDNRKITIITNNTLTGAADENRLVRKIDKMLQDNSNEFDFAKGGV